MSLPHSDDANRLPVGRVGSLRSPDPVPLIAGMLDIEGRSREYWFAWPTTNVASHPVPLVLALHGGGIHGEAMAPFCGLHELGWAEGFAVVYPNGSGRVPHARTWNAGECCGHAQRYGIDDVAFMDALIDELLRRYPIDERRIYATGMSNGGMMCYRLASELSERILAIAPVAGCMAQPTCHPRRPVSVLHFHGTQDDIVPIAGGRGPRSRPGVEYRSLTDTLENWAAANKCAGELRRRWVLGQSGEGSAAPPEGEDVAIELLEYSPGREGSRVAAYVIHGGGHTWPGRVSPYPQLGRNVPHWSANSRIWEFFAQCPARSS